jgi:predicted DNA-binding transcriptional regulator AlpA
LHPKLNNEQLEAINMKYLRAKALADRQNVSISTIWRWTALSIIPQPIRPTKRTSLFDVEAVDAALAKLDEANAGNETITEAVEKLGTSS